jgi:hypothetical protein
LIQLIALAAPVHVALLDEFLGRFRGPSRRHWYLTDGGHFENTGCYELIRRRLPFIVVCDCGCDAGYHYSDLANLVRRARVDLGAEITFLTRDELDGVVSNAEGTSAWRTVIGTLDELRPCPRPAAADGVRSGDCAQPRSRYHVALAYVRYLDWPEAKFSLLLLLKPSLIGDEPADVIEYRSGHGAFPQESTTDQFFDEAQWESYRRLGLHIGETSLPTAGLMDLGRLMESVGNVVRSSADRRTV